METLPPSAVNAIEPKPSGAPSTGGLPATMSPLASIACRKLPVASITPVSVLVMLTVLVPLATV
ncbi:MAG: hypothetical protein HC843_04685 [Sphingomonadales bacterium]|nr:hypothetical protein [Sphingomonadales bacterium]